MRSEIFPLFLEWIAPDLLSDYKNKYPSEYDEYLESKKVSITTTLKAKEIEFEKVLMSLEYPDGTEVYRQFIIGDSFIDFAVRKHSKEFGNSLYLIEFDEKYHRSESQKIKDAERERRIAEFVSKEEDVSFSCLVRIPYDKVGIAYTYLLPYITGIETSMCSDKIQGLLYYKCLRSDFD